MKPLINILTRTAKRPNGFNKCRESILAQTYDNIRHIVSVEHDDEVAKGYTANAGVDPVIVNAEELMSQYDGPKLNNRNFWETPYNLYLNALGDVVEDGWVLYIDDDDMLVDSTVIERIVPHLGEDKLLVVQMQYPTGRVLPTSGDIKTQTARLGGIGGSCIIFHSKWLKSAKWDAYKCSDFRLITQLTKLIPNKEYLETVVVRLNNNGGLGKKIDING